MENIIKYKDNLQFFSNYSSVAENYGMFSKQITMTGPDGSSDVYLVFGINPIPDDVNPVEIINRNKRNENIFYPENFAIALYDENPLVVWERITIYLAYAEFMCSLYEQFDTPLPEAIRSDELMELKNFYCNQNNPAFDMETRNNYADGIREFFKNERTKSKFSKEWKKFYRSEMYDENKSFAKNFITFLKRNEPETNLDVLLESNSNLKKVYISEHHYKEFHEIIKKNYPNLKYSVSDLKVVDKGLIVDPDTKEAVLTQFGKTVTQEEYDKICEERFYIDGFACLDNLTPSYFEGRDLFYKASDENIIASVANNIAFRWVKCVSLEFLQKKGKVDCIDIPVSQMKNFFVTMKQYDIPFSIDNSVDRKPNFETLHILYNTADYEKIKKIIAGLTLAQMSLAHVSIGDVSFQIDINKVDSLITNAASRLNSKTNSCLNIDSDKIKNNIDLTI